MNSALAPARPWGGGSPCAASSAARPLTRLFVTPHVAQFVTKYVATIGVDYGVKPLKIRGTEVRVNFWDLAGGEEYAEIRNEFYKDAQGVRSHASLDHAMPLVCLSCTLTPCLPCIHCITTQGILVFDVNSRKSFEAMSAWRKEAAALGAAEAYFVLCGNKTDVGKRVVSADEGAKLAALLGLQYFETTAKDGDGVTEMFHALFARVVEKLNI